MSETYVRLHPDDIKMWAEIVAQHMAKLMLRHDKLMNLTELSKEIGIPYNTLTRKKLPYHKVGRGRARKLYKPAEVISALRKS